MVDREEDFSGENGSVRDLEYGENNWQISYLFEGDRYV